MRSRHDLMRSIGVRSPSLQLVCRRHGVPWLEHLARYPNRVVPGCLSCVLEHRFPLAKIEQVPAHPFVAVVSQRQPVDSRRTIPLDNELLFTRSNHSSTDNATDDEVKVALLRSQERGVPIDDKQPPVRIEQDIAGVRVGMT